jgi:hypothetical protein
MGSEGSKRRVYLMSAADGRRAAGGLKNNGDPSAAEPQPWTAARPVRQPQRGASGAVAGHRRWNKELVPIGCGKKERNQCRSAQWWTTKGTGA